jgi:outer membrane protein OmpA-like peptidoglycan-associated protein
MNRYSLAATLLAVVVPLTVGCASKKYVRNEVTPTVNKVNELDDLTAKNTRDIRDVDSRSQQGIQQATSAADQAGQKALAAGQAANQANQSAMQAANRVTSLAGTVENIDNYKPVGDPTTVLFGFDKADLTRKDKKTLDQLGQQLANQRHFLIEVHGYTDSTGPKDYNYQLSQQRANAVIQYLASKYNVPTHQIYVIGLGEDNPAAANTSAKGRAENRRVDVRLMSNTVDAQSAQANSPSQQNNSNQSR